MNAAYLVAPIVGRLIAMGLRLPPLVGFLVAGFVLNALGYEETEMLRTIADLGVTLLLFTIGLKLNVRTLLRKEVWGTATAHMVCSTGFLIGVLALLKLVGFAALADADVRVLAILGFALSFSSTVFVVKILEERGETRALYGRLAIGILIMQDIFAVVFITASTGELPSPWALGLLALIPLAPLLRGLLERVGHGEMQVLYGVVLALGLGYALFEFVGIKGDLGALIIGMLLATHPSAAGMSRALFNMKELFLVGFFVSIGLADLPTWSTAGVAALLVLLIFAKGALFYAFFNRFRLRRRTSFLGALALTNYSEFGLIVAVLAGANGWLTDDWLVTLSIAVALSFGVSAILNRRSTAMYEKMVDILPAQDPERLNSIDRPIHVGDAEAVVLGMGRVGRGAYDRLTGAYGLHVQGIDTDDERVAALSDRGYNVIEADATDPDFWEKLTIAETVDIVILALPHHDPNVVALDQLRKLHYDGEVAAVVQHRDEIESIRDHGADDVFHLYAGAGIALADGAAEAAGLEPH
ncbi:cation:proton antiporter [Hoyosella sp. YIM 151337]|uniref:cation:proton antiporter family protein n=1 Tax=Hoyosella sp. YIM 151337 TaxID=2992742 RepID=UPI002236822A|nr:cation:proton antiporter family protein [Hoyosella sp. YIM 151337]MCW4353725.1 cation:proton antiporter [Hoyosella sp. YIM 151337]